MVALLEICAGGIGAQAVAYLGEEELSRVCSVGSGRVRIQPVVDLHDERGDRAQPIEPWIVQDELQQRAAAIDAPVLALVSDAFHFEQRAMHVEKCASSLFQALSWCRGLHDAIIVL